MSLVLGPDVEPIPGYRLIERLGRGGFGEVWKAEAPGGMHKAIKFVFGDLSAAGESAQAEQERKSLERIKSIRHPYILSLERIEEVDGQLVIVMELADRSLWDRYKDCRAENLSGIPRDELLAYMAETAEALDLMNIKLKLQHLDVKPQNLFLVYNHIKVADFGLVKELRGNVSRMTGGVTPVYAAPETFDGFVSQHSDQYSLAIVYQELLTGSRPFQGSNAYQLLQQHMTAAPDLSVLPPQDRPHVARALAKKADDRFPCCGDLIKALRGSGGAAMPTSASRRPASEINLELSDSAASIDSTPDSADRSATMQMRKPTERAPATEARTPTKQSDSKIDSIPKTPSESPAESDGVLAPTLVIGLGGAGGAAIRQLRSAIRSRFGGAETPHIRLLAIDTDFDALRSLTSNPDDRLAKDEVYHAPLHRPSHYLKADTTGDLDVWLGAANLHRLPRNPTHAGQRAFGRLAFMDHAPAIAKRIKSLIEAIRDPKAHSAAQRATGLAFRTAAPTIYVVASLGGGTGSGLLIDLAYLARLCLREAGETGDNLHGLLMLPNYPIAGAAPPSALNAIAALLELNHFSSPGTQYACRINAKFTIPGNTAAPFNRCVLIPDGAKNGTPNTADISQISAVLVNELTTPLGAKADQHRAVDADDDGELRPQSIATYRLAWPGSALRRIAAQEIGLDLIRGWANREASHLKQPVEVWLEEQWDLRKLSPERVAEAFHRAATSALGTAPADRIEAIIASGAGSEQAFDHAAASKVMEAVVAFLGPIEGVPGETKTALLPSLFEKVTPDVVRQCDQQLAELAGHYVERPGFRIAGAEEAIRQIGDRARQALTSYESLASSLLEDASTELKKLAILIGWTGGGAVPNADRPQRAPKRRDQQTADIVAILRDYAKKHYQAILAKELTAVYRGMVGSVPEYLQDVNHCRQRLDEVEKLLTARLEAAKSTTGTPLGRGKDLLGGAIDSVALAARKLVDGIPNVEIEALDGLIQGKVATLFRSLVNFCLDPGPRGDLLAEVIEKATVDFVETRIRPRSSIDVLMNEYSGGATESIIQEAFDAAMPSLAKSDRIAPTVFNIVAVPRSEHADEFRDSVSEVIGETDAITFADGVDDILFFREAEQLDLRDLPHFDQANCDSYEKADKKAEVTFHSRIDIAWLPLDATVGCDQG